MSLTLTVWRLTDLNGCPARCLVSERDGRWQVLVWHKTSIVFWQRCDTDDEALARADELWRVLVQHGWSPDGVTAPLAAVRQPVRVRKR